MKRGTRVTIFIASMALTFGSLMAFVGPRHCGPMGHHWQEHRMHGGWNHQGCDAANSETSTAR